MGYYVSVAPASEPLTTSEAKLSTRIDHSTEDALIDEYVTAARVWIERQFDLALIDQTVIESFDDVPESGYFNLTVKPVIETTDVTAVKYYDENNTLTVWSSTNYIVIKDGYCAKVQIADDASWPTTYVRPGAWQITYTPGFGASASDVPLVIKTVCRMLVWDMYENRGNQPMPKTISNVDAFLNPYITRRV